MAAWLLAHLSDVAALCVWHTVRMLRLSLCCSALSFAAKTPITRNRALTVCHHRATTTAV